MTDSEKTGRVQQAERALRFARAAAAAGCPCGRPDLKTQHTSGRIRYVLCRGCGRRQKIAAD